MLDEVLNRWPSLGAIEVSTAQYGQFASVEGRVERALVAGSRLHRASERRRKQPPARSVAVAPRQASSAA
jgi:hypothetical protein